MKARGARIVVDHVNWAVPKYFFATDTDGCISFQAAENTGFRVAIYAEARLGGSDNVTVRAWESLAQANINNPDQVKKWIFMANPGGAPRRVYYQNEPSELSNLIAFGSFVFHWVDSQTSPRLPGARYLGLVTFIPMAPVIATMIGGAKAADWMYMVPILGQQQLLTNVLRGEGINWVHLATTSGVTLLVSFALVVVLTKLLRSERVVYGS